MHHKQKRGKQKGYMHAIVEAPGCSISWREANKSAELMMFRMKQRHLYA